MDGHVGRYQHHAFMASALAVWLTVSWPVLHAIGADLPFRGQPVPLVWLMPFAAFGLLVVIAGRDRLTAWQRWVLLGGQVLATAAMARIDAQASAAVLLTIVAWQAAMITTPRNALIWVASQSFVMLLALDRAQPNFEYCYVLGLAGALQVFLVLTARAMRAEATTARELASRNLQLRGAQAMLAANVRLSERTRISRELHDAWGHELTALGLQLEIASHRVPPGAALEPVTKARELSRELLGKVRDVVGTLRAAERYDLRLALQELAASVPAPAVHLEIADDIAVTPDEAHVLIRCGQEALTNAMRHARASQVWLTVASDADGVHLVARDDGRGATEASSIGRGLNGMRERLEAFGGHLAVRSEAGMGFELRASLPARA